MKTAKIQITDYYRIFSNLTINDIYKDYLKLYNCYYLINIVW